MPILTGIKGQRRLIGNAGKNGQNLKLRAVTDARERPSAIKGVATDWVTGGCLIRCLMYSRKQMEGLCLREA